MVLPMLAKQPAVTAHFPPGEVTPCRELGREFVATMPQFLHKTGIPVPVRTEQAVGLGSDPQVPGLKAALLTWWVSPQSAP